MRMGVRKATCLTIALFLLGANSYVRKPAVTQLGCYWLILNELPPRA